MTQEKVLTFSSKKDRKGIYISKIQYDLLNTFILSTLKVKGEISLPSLIEAASRELRSSFQGNVAWSLLRVKYALEEKGIISTRLQLQPHRTQLLRLTRKRAVL